MDQNKLFRAFEKSKAERLHEQPKSQIDVARNMIAERPLASPASRVLAELVAKDTLMERKGSLKEMRNPVPMTLNEMKKNRLVYSGMNNRAVLNAYRELRIELLDKSESSNISVMISSVDALDNSIATALNLAISFSLDFQSSALLVDCNPYGTELQSLVTSPLTLGITDYILSDGLALEDMITPSGIERVSVISSGNHPSSAVELFSSQAMHDLFYELKNRYKDRCIVINAPPVLASSEARVLTRYCHQSVLTVPYGRANMDAIGDAVDALGAANVSGLVYQQ
ncbi:CpsD/CapB family tyrosine-protein kinase [Reinekea sp.]|uniref:CpsD/CapB family tyrosine-protein kinase n=1 Tax=Reinekea sp. TaxID=1970455 RepID=UPI002A822667|nr:CpsD/CapB family tyrosine-protein kinase [Reinekea sp.]